MIIIFILIRIKKYWTHCKVDFTINIVVYCAKVELIVGSYSLGGKGHDSYGSVSS
jgi:hypothetical protein